MCECKTRKKDKADSYFFLREGLAFLRQRSNRAFWGGLLQVGVFTTAP